MGKIGFIPEKFGSRGISAANYKGKIYRISNKFKKATIYNRCGY